MTTIRTTIAVIISKAMTGVVAIRRVSGLRSRFQIVNHISVRFSVRSVTSTYRLIVKDLRFYLITNTAFMVGKCVIKIYVMITIHSAKRQARFLAIAANGFTQRTFNQYYRCTMVVLMFL